jgi:hypothetical protein
MGADCRDTTIALAFVSIVFVVAAMFPVDGVERVIGFRDAE